MTRDELIKKLQQFGENYDVMVRGYEDGYDDINNVELVNVKKNTNTYTSGKKQVWYDGKHDRAGNIELKDNTTSSVICLGFNLEKDDKNYT